MDEGVGASLAERVERLERNVKEMREELRLLDGRRTGDELHEGPPVASSGQPFQRRMPAPIAALFPETSRGGWGEDARGSEFPGWRRFRFGDLGDYRSGEWWLGKIGIGLLLFGIGFLYLLSVERGWITPTVRVSFGLALGTVLTALGLRVYGDRRPFSQVLMGGGIGVFYATGFAAFWFYALVPHALAFAFMVAVTILAFSLSVRGDGAALSLIGTIGGFGTPFLLDDGSGSSGGLVLYACVVLAGALAIHLYAGWRSLLVVSFAGAWAVLLAGLWSSVSVIGGRSSEDAAVLQAGVTFAWLLLWLAPALRVVLQARNTATSLPANVPVPGATLAHATSVSSPLVALAFTQMLWTPENGTLGLVALVTAAPYALAGLAFRRLEGPRSGGAGVSFTQALVALLLLTISAVLLLDGDTLLFILAAEAALLHYAARRLDSRVLSFEAHLLWTVVAAWMCGRLLAGVLSDFFAGPSPQLSLTASFTDLAVVALALFSSRAVSPRGVATLYRASAHAAILAWLWRELSVSPGGEAFVTVAWGLYAVALLVVGLRFDRVALFRCGITTLFLVVGKLFLVDLAAIETAWRVLLFLGFGALFLVLSFYSRSIWRPRPENEDAPDANGS